MSRHPLEGGLVDDKQGRAQILRRVKAGDDKRPIIHEAVAPDHDLDHAVYR